MTEHGIPEQWNVTKMTPVFKKGDKTLAANYRPVSVMFPLAKLYATCLNFELERQAQANGLRGAMQAGFQKHYSLEDLVLLVDYAIAWVQQHKQSLCICCVYLEKAFDTVPRSGMLEVLLEYGIDEHLVEVICRLYTNTLGQVVGDN